MASVTVTFGTAAAANDAVTGGWIQAQMRTQDEAGQPICAHVLVEGGDISVSLPVGNCTSGGRGGRALNAAETEVVDLYRRRHLDQPQFSPGELEAFIRQAMRL